MAKNTIKYFGLFIAIISVIIPLILIFEAAQLFNGMFFLRYFISDFIIKAIFPTLGFLVFGLPVGFYYYKNKEINKVALWLHIVSMIIMLPYLVGGLSCFLHIGCSEGLIWSLAIFFGLLGSIAASIYGIGIVLLLYDRLKKSWKLSKNEKLYFSIIIVIAIISLVIYLGIWYGEQSRTPETCNRITDIAKRDDCYIRTAMDFPETVPCEEIVDAKTKDDCYLVKSHLLQDASACEALASTEERENCLRGLSQ